MTTHEEYDDEGPHRGFVLNDDAWAEFRRDPRENIVLWSQRDHAECASRYAAASLDSDNAHLTFVRLASDDEIDELLVTAGRQFDP